MKQIARTAEKIKNASQQKIRMVTCRAENAENELCSAKEKIFNMESELILLRDDSANLRYIIRGDNPTYSEHFSSLRVRMKDLTEELELTKQNLMFERQKVKNNITEEPEQDFDEQLKSQKRDYEDLLKEKDIEIDHLDQRLRERSEKLNDQMSKVNLGTKENISLKKRLDKLTDEKNSLEATLLESKMDLDKESFRQRLQASVFYYMRVTHQWGSTVHEIQKSLNIP